MSAHQTRIVAILRTAAWTIGAVAVLLLVWPQSIGGTVAYVRVDGHSMDGTFKTGDLVVVRRQRSYHVGDVVSYRVPKGEFGAGAQVIHRIIGGSGSKGFITQGDNKPFPDKWYPKTSDVVGTWWIRVPGIGVRAEVLRSPVHVGGLCAALTVLVGLWPRRKKVAA